MSKFEGRIEKQKEKDFNKAQRLVERRKFNEAEKIYKKLVPYYRSRSVTNYHNILLALVQLYSKMQNYTESLPIIERLLKFYQESKNFKMIGILYNELSNAHFYQGDIKLAKYYCNKSLKLARHQGLVIGVVLNILNLGNYLHFEGRFEEALKKYKEAETLALKHNYQREINKSFASLFMIYADLGDFHESEIYYEKLCKNFPLSIEDTNIIISTYNNLAVIYEKQKDYKSQLDILEKALEISKQSSLEYSELRTSFNIGLALINLNKIGEAQEAFNFVKEKSKELEDRIFYGRSIFGFGVIDLFYKDLEKAIEKFNKSLKIAKETNDISFSIRNYRFLGEIYRLKYDNYESYRNFTQALKFYHNISDNIKTLELKQKFRAAFEDLPEIIDELNEILESKTITPIINELNEIRSISIDTCKKITSRFEDFAKNQGELMEKIQKLTENINIYKEEYIEYDETSKMIEQDKIKVLHLSDLHFGIENTKIIPKAELGKRDTTLIKLIECLKLISNHHKDWSPDIIIITGDIGFAGKKEDYVIAKKWLNHLLSELDLNNEALIICPGNHDRFVEDIMKSPKYPKDINDSDSKWYKFESENSDERFREFIDFSQDFLIPLKIKNKDSYLGGYRDIQGLRFIVLNSARYACGGVKDKGNLFLGWPDVNNLVGDKIFSDLNKYDESIIIISLFHHPDNWFHDNVLHQKGNHPATYNFLAERSHIMFSGHIHATKIGPPRKIGDGATHLSVGASYLRQDNINNCEIIRLNLLQREAERLVIDFDTSEVEWLPKYTDVKKINLRSHLKEIRVKTNSQIEKAIKKNLDKLMEKLDKFEKKFTSLTSKAAGALEFQIKVLPKNLENNLFEDNKFSSLINNLKNNKYGPSMIRDLLDLIINRLKLSREGLYSAVPYSLDRFAMGGNIFIAKEGIVVFKWYYSEPESKRYKNRFPKAYSSGFILGFFDILYALFTNFGYLKDLKLIFSIDKLKGWKYTPFPDSLEVDIFWETSNDYFEPYEFECEVKELSLGEYKLGLVKDKIMRQILLELGCDEEFQFHPEIIRDYK